LLAKLYVTRKSWPFSDLNSDVVLYSVTKCKSTYLLIMGL
jgi:hypothetical protein